MSGTLYGLGLGPGDPDLITLKACRILRQTPVIAWPAPDTGPSFARAIAAPHLPGGQSEIPIVVPMRTERFPARDVYDRAAAEIASHLDAGRDVAVLCEGDPFFYGSFMYLFERLAARYRTEVVPGVSSMMAAASAAGRPLAARNDVLSVLPGPLPDEAMAARLAVCEAAAIIKVGRHFKRIRTLIDRQGLMERAVYVERVSLDAERRMPLSEVPEDTAPYFSMILIYKGGEGWIHDLPPASTGVSEFEPGNSDA
jgi:precorrin-2/cobalt-factor-2 C20-methyltransferase